MIKSHELELLDRIRRGVWVLWERGREKEDPHSGHPIIDSLRKGSGHTRSLLNGGEEWRNGEWRRLIGNSITLRISLKVIKGDKAQKNPTKGGGLDPSLDRENSKS